MASHQIPVAVELRLIVVAPDASAPKRVKREKGVKPEPGKPFTTKLFRLEGRDGLYRRVGRTGNNLKTENPLATVAIFEDGLVEVVRATAVEAELRDAGLQIVVPPDDQQDGKQEGGADVDPANPGKHEEESE